MNTPYNYIERLDILDEINHCILESRSTNDIVHSVLGHINRLMPKCQWASIHLFDASKAQETVLGVYPSEDGAFSAGKVIPLDTFKTVSVSQQEEFHTVEDLSSLGKPTFIEKKLLGQGFRSFLSIPLIHSSGLIGSFNLASVEAWAFTEEYVVIARKVGRSIAIAINNSRLVEIERQHTKELLAVSLVSSALRIAQTRAQMLPIILDQLIGLLDAKGALVAMQGLPNKIIEIELGFGSWERSTGVRIENKGVFDKVISTRQPYMSNNAADDLLLKNTKSLGNPRAVAFVPLISQSNIIGVLGIDRRTPIAEGELRILISIADMVASAIQRVTLTEDLQKSNTELSLAYNSTLEGWARALELRDRETEGHTRRVTELTMRLAREMGISGDDLLHLRRGTILHDIGKMGIPDSILLKPGKLTDAEWEIMRKHPVYAVDMLSPIDFLRPALDVPYCHHEKWDGTGYPRGLKGEEIPLPARIFTIVDVWDALTDEGRPYRKSWTREKTLDYVRAQSGKHFDPHVVHAFLDIMEND